MQFDDPSAYLNDLVLLCQIVKTNNIAKAMNTFNENNFKFFIVGISDNYVLQRFTYWKLLNAFDILVVLSILDELLGINLTVNIMLSQIMPMRFWFHFSMASFFTISIRHNIAGNVTSNCTRGIQAA